MTPHIIRLRDPWQWVAVGNGKTSASRWFNRPTGLGPNTRVVLAVTGIAELRSIRLNDQALVVPSASGWEIADRLEPRNQLQLEFQGPDAGDAQQQLKAFLAAGNVRLEIYE